MSNDRLTPRLNLFTRIRELRRTLWQLRSLLHCGFANFRLAGEVISSGQCLQRKWELLAMMALVKRLAPDVVMEIGTYRGGTLRCWSAVCPPTTRFVSIDLPGGDFGGGYSSGDVESFRNMLKPGQTLTCLLKNSQDPATKAELSAILGSRKIDFLFIDGDHSYRGVKTDYELYQDLVRPGGLIGLHDIVPHSARPTCRVHEFWDELKSRRDARELVDRDGFDTWGGIGVVRA